MFPFGSSRYGKSQPAFLKNLRELLSEQQPSLVLIDPHGPLLQRELLRWVQSNLEVRRIHYQSSGQEPLDGHDDFGRWADDGGSNPD